MRVAALGAILALIAFAYEVGEAKTERVVEQLREELAALAAANAELRGQAARLEAARVAAEAEAQRYRDRYGADLPSAEVAELVTLVRRRVADGANPARLAALLNAAADERACMSPPETKRFLVTTPLARGGAGTAVTFAGRRITVSGVGVPARASNGAPEAWFDPAEPVQVRFTLLGGEVIEERGVLPLHKSVVLGDTEYRFGLVPGARGLAEVTVQSCPYGPGGA